jgi:folate-binding protein YgfZ
LSGPGEGLLRELHREHGGTFSEGSSSCRPAHYADSAAEYRALGEEAGLVDLGDRELIAARGADVVGLLHRLGTADLKSLSPGQGVGLLFTTPQGRTVERCLALREEEGLSLLCAAGRGETLRSWIARYTFREEASLEPTDPPLRALGLFGPRAVAEAAAATGADLSPLPLAHGLRLEWEGEALTLLRGDPVGGAGVVLLASEGLLPRLWSRLAALALPCGERAYEARRIEALVPDENREITEERNPWELGLYDHISMSKGCYVGQEVVARLRNYEKIRRRLALLATSASPEEVEGKPLLLAGKTAARVTSAASRPGGETVALATLPVETLDEGTSYELEGSGTRAVLCRAVPPPPEL